jgi:hypothetical protein
MADTRIKKLSWLAALSLAVGGLAACGEEVVTDTASASRVEASRGSDQHLYNQAAEIEARNAAREAAQAEADRYVEGLESRAETVTTTTTPPSYYPHGYDYGGEEEQPAPLPGSHNVPN